MKNPKIATPNTTTKVDPRNSWKSGQLALDNSCMVSL